MRWPFKIAVVAAVLGVVVNVLVAWGCALWVAAPASERTADLSGFARSFVPAEWVVAPAGDAVWGEFSFSAAVTARTGMRVENCFVEARGVSRAEQQPVSFVSGLVTVQACGWPCVCLGSACLENGTPPHLVAALPVPAFLQGPSPRGGWTLGWNAVRLRPGLPLRPITASFVVNSLLYAAIVAGLITVPRAVRCMLRRRKGRCTACGYDRRGLSSETACPECGLVVAAKE